MKRVLQALAIGVAVFCGIGLAVATREHEPVMATTGKPTLPAEIVMHAPTIEKAAPTPARRPVAATPAPLPVTRPQRSVLRSSSPAPQRKPAPLPRNQASPYQPHYRWTPPRPIYRPMLRRFR